MRRQLLTWTAVGLTVLVSFRRLGVRWDRDAGRWFAFVLVACAGVLQPALTSQKERHDVLGSAGEGHQCDTTRLSAFKADHDFDLAP